MEHRPSAPTEPTAADDDVPLLPTAPPPPDRRGWRLVALASVPVLALAVLGLALAGGAPGDGTAPPEAVATVVPAAAWDGKDSMMLPVTAEPHTGLVNGQTGRVTGEGFPPGEQVGIVMCTSQAAFGGGAGYCDIMDFTSTTVDDQGRFAADHAIRRFLDAGGVRWDCTGGNVDPVGYLEARAAGTLGPDPTTWSCIIAAGVLTNYDISGGMPLAFAPDGPVVDPVALDPSACQYVHTAAGIVPTCPGMDGGPSPVCGVDEYVVLADDGTATCEAMPTTPSDGGVIEAPRAPAGPATTVVDPPGPGVGEPSATTVPPVVTAPTTTVVPSTTVAEPTTTTVEDGPSAGSGPATTGP